ncbi:MAG: DUF2141 domain-containing protein [Pseudomonadota bacterium]
MNRTVSILALIASTMIAIPMASASQLTVNVEGIEKAQGTIMLGLYDEASYKGSAAINGASLNVESDRVTVTFEGLAPGEYAVQLYHDINDDGEMNTNPFGMPTEPFAFSNDAKGRFGPATWADAKFVLRADGTTHTITLN